MDRRELLKLVSAATGSIVFGGEIFLSGCKDTDKPVEGSFTPKDISFFDEVAETILPKTDTPGAKDAEVGKFMAKFSTDCYDDTELKILKEGISKLNDAAEKKYNADFVHLNPSQKEALLVQADGEAKKYNEEKEQSKKDQAPHYFTLMKQMVLLGFFTSKPGVTKVLRWIPVPGKYLGCVDYKEGETSWV